MWKKKGQQTIPERPEEEEEASLDKPSRRNITCGNKIDKVLESHQSQRRYKDEFSLNLFSLSKDKAKKKLLGKDYMNLNVMSNKEKFSKTTSFPFIHINNDGDNDRNFREIKLTCEEREDLKTTKFNTKQNEINTVETFENLELTQYASTNTEKMR